MRAAVGGKALAPTLATLAARTGSRRRDARAHARTAVGVAALRAPRPRHRRARRARHAGATPASQPAREFARPLLKRRHQALVALGTDLAHAAPEARHAARLAAKKLRYAAEFFATLYSKKKTRAYRKALAALQEELGAWNDAAVAARLAADITGAQSPAAAAFEGWAAAQGASRGDALASAWTRFTKARPFW